MSADNLGEKSISILKHLKEQGPLWVREIGDRTHIRRADVIRRLRLLRETGYVCLLEERKDHGRNYHAITPKAETYLSGLQEREKLKEDEIERLRRQYQMSEEESTELYDSLRSDLDDCFNRVTAWYPDYGGFSTDLEVHSEDYDGSITIEWTLTSKGKEKLRPMKKLRPVTIVFKKKSGPKK